MGSVGKVAWEGQVSERARPSQIPSSAVWPLNPSGPVLQALVRNAESQAPPQEVDSVGPRDPGTCVLTAQMNLMQVACSLHQW